MDNKKTKALKLKEEQKMIKDWLKNNEPSVKTTDENISHFEQKSAFCSNTSAMSP